MVRRREPLEVCNRVTLGKRELNAGAEAQAEPIETEQDMSILRKLDNDTLNV
jgi:hypothetical protein